MLSMDGTLRNLHLYVQYSLSGTERPFDAAECTRTWVSTSAVTFRRPRANNRKSDMGLIRDVDTTRRCAQADLLKPSTLHVLLRTLDLACTAQCTISDSAAALTLKSKFIGNLKEILCANTASVFAVGLHIPTQFPPAKRWTNQHHERIDGNQRLCHLCRQPAGRCAGARGRGSFCKGSVCVSKTIIYLAGVASV